MSPKSEKFTFLNPNQKTRAQFSPIDDPDYAWIFIWDNFGYDPTIEQWYKLAADNRWPKCEIVEVPLEIIESACLFFEKAKMV